MRKKWLLIICLCLFALAGCSKKNPDKPNNNENNNQNEEQTDLDKLLYDEPGAETYRVYFNALDGSEYKMYTVDLGELLRSPEQPYREGYRFLGWFKDKDCTEKFNFLTDYIIESTMLYAGWEQVELRDFSYLLSEYVPSEVTSNLELPKQLESDSFVHLTWDTDKPYTLTGEGLINPARVDEKVVVTLEVNDHGDVSRYTKEVTVKGITFTPLSIRQGKAVFGYYSYWNFTGYTEDELLEDVVNVSFAYVNGDYTLDMRALSSKVMNFLSARQAGVRVVLSVQGAENSSQNFSNAAKTAENRKKLAQSICEAITTYHFDGVDLDWEYPGWFNTGDKSWEADNYTALVKEIYESVKALDEDYIVTAAIPGGAEGFKRYNLEEVQNYLDYIHLMTYDLEATPKIYHHTALYSNVGKATATQASVADSVEIFTLKGVPADKLVIGIAFYGKYVEPQSSTNGGLGGNMVANSKYNTITYSSIAQTFLPQIGSTVTYYFDDVCKAPYLYDSANNYFITYENETSIKAKCNFVREKSLAGVMIWELGEDTTGTLMDATLTSMKRKY